MESKLVEFLPPLRAASEMLEKYGQAAQASILKNLIALVTKDPPAFRRHMASMDVWGGAGSVSDVGSFSDGYEPRSAAYRDTVRFTEAMIDVAELMRKHGFETARSVSWAETFRYWNSVFPTEANGDNST